MYYGTLKVTSKRTTVRALQERALADLEELKWRLKRRCLSFRCLSYFGASNEVPTVSLRRVCYFVLCQAYRHNDIRSIRFHLQRPLIRKLVKLSQEFKFPKIRAPAALMEAREDRRDQKALMIFNLQGAPSRL